MKIAGLAIQYIGGKENIKSVAHCATRPRFQLGDNGLRDKEAISDIEGVKGVFLIQSQFQIILGSDTANLVCTEVQKQLGVMEEKPEGKNEERGNPVQRFIKMLSDISIPIIPAIAAGGLLMGLSSLLISPLIHNQTVIALLPQWQGLATTISAFVNAPFVFLPILISFSTTKKFGGSPFLGAAVGMIMVHPNLLNAYQIGTVDPPVWDIFGFQIAAIGYQGTVLPILAVSWVLANIEKRLRRVTPFWLDNLTTPLLSILVTSFLTSIFVGPVLREAGNLLAVRITWLYNTLGSVDGALFGFAYAPITMTGIHRSFIAIETQLLADSVRTGGGFIFSTASMSNVAQGAAVLTVLLMTKNDKIESTCPASGMSAFLGITEPAMFGMTLKSKYPFYATMTGSAMGNTCLAATKTLARALGAAGLPGFISIKPDHYMNFAIGIILSMGVSSALTTVFWKKVGLEKQGSTKAAPVSRLLAPKTLDTRAIVLYAPMKGGMIPVERSKDEVFASKALEDGMTINPEDSMVYAPYDETVTPLFPTRHAVGIRIESGVEVLIHIRINIIQLDGRGFKAYVTRGGTIKQGDPLILVDLDLIREKELNPQTMMILPEEAGLRIRRSADSWVDKDTRAVAVYK